MTTVTITVPISPRPLHARHRGRARPLPSMVSARVGIAAKVGGGAVQAKEA